ncbi:MAG: hypothetical protein AAGF90_02750, partial [Pseudomonadota bacterium]
MRRASLMIGVSTAALSATAAAAQEIALRGGDEFGASWVELDPRGARVVVEDSGSRQVDLVAEGVDWDLDLSAVTLVGAASRVLDAREVSNPTGTRLRFLLACDCAFAAVMTGDAIRIEFRDRTDDRNAAARADAEPEEIASAAPEIDDEELLRRRGGTRFAPLRAPRPNARGRAGAGVDIDADLPALAAVADEPPSTDIEATPADKAEEVRIARRKLLEQLSRAAEQGLLEFASEEAAEAAPPPPEPDRTELAEAAPPPAPEPEAAPIPPEPEAEASAFPEATEPPRPADPIELPVRARTAVDKAFRPDRRDTIVVTEACVEDWRLDMR